jgi:hypothetical protein
MKGYGHGQWSSEEVAVPCDDECPQHFQIGDEADVCGPTDEIVDVSE